MKALRVDQHYACRECGHHADDIITGCSCCAEFHGDVPCSVAKGEVFEAMAEALRKMIGYAEAQDVGDAARFGADLTEARAILKRAGKD